MREDITLVEKDFSNDNTIHETVTLILTNQCNLRCTYCYEKNKNPKSMNVDDAKKILKYHLNQDKKESLIIELFGGEPFLEFELIKTLVEFLKNGKWKRQYKVFIDSNGTLIGEIQKKWLRDNRDIVSCGISLDGTPDMHNQNRSNSFDSIDIDFFKNLYPNQTSKMTISKETVSNLAEGIIYLQERGVHLTANLAYGIDWVEQEGEILVRELKKLADYYLEHPQIEVCSILDFDLTFMTDVPQSQKQQMQYCGAGNYMYTYDVDGKVYPCQFFTPLSIGERANEIDEKSIQKSYDSAVIDQKCQNCYARNLCPTCIGTNYMLTDNMFCKDETMCKLFKIQLSAVAYLKYNLWERGRLNLSKEDEYMLLKGIKLVQKI